MPIVTRIRKKYGIAEDNFSDEKCEEWHENSTSESRLSFLEEVRNTLKFFGLTENFHDSLTSYIFFDKFVTIKTNFTIKVDPNNPKVAIIEIYGPIKEADRDFIIKEAERMVRRRKPLAWERRKELSNLNEHLKIFRAYRTSPTKYHAAEELFGKDRFENDKVEIKKIENTVRHVNRLLKEAFPSDSFSK